MYKVVFAAVLSLVLAACHGGDRSSTQPSSPQPAADAPAAGAHGAVGNALEKMVDPNVAGCIDKVRAKQFAEALPLCLQAANADPDNQDVKSALAEARRQAANLASAGEQAGAAMGAAKEAQRARDAAKEAVSGKVPSAAGIPEIPEMPKMPKMP